METEEELAWGETEGNKVIHTGQHRNRVLEMKGEDV